VIVAVAVGILIVSSVRSNIGPDHALGTAATITADGTDARFQAPLMLKRQRKSEDILVNLKGGTSWPEHTKPAQVTLPAPSFSGKAAMPDGSFKDVSLEDFKGQWLVLIFYPLDFTFVCPTELTAFSDKMAEFKKLGAAVVGVSIDSEFTHLQWMKTPRKEGGVGELQYPLLSDLTHRIGEAYGCLHPSGHHVRGTFIIDPKGIVRHISLNDPPVGRNADEVLRLINGYQFTDKHGEVCPHGWVPGSRTIKPTPEDKGEYFSEAAAKST